MVTLLGPPEREHYSSQAQKGRLNVCNVKIFFLFLVSVLLRRWGELQSLKEIVKGMKSVVLFME